MCETALAGFVGMYGCLLLAIFGYTVYQKSTKQIKSQEDIYQAPIKDRRSLESSKHPATHNSEFYLWIGKRRIKQQALMINIKPNGDAFVISGRFFCPLSIIKYSRSSVNFHYLKDYHNFGSNIIQLWESKWGRMNIIKIYKLQSIKQVQLSNLYSLTSPVFTKSWTKQECKINKNWI